MTGLDIERVKERAREIRESPGGFRGFPGRCRELRETKDVNFSQGEGYDR